MDKYLAIFKNKENESFFFKNMSTSFEFNEILSSIKDIISEENVIIEDYEYDLRSSKLLLCCLNINYDEKEYNNLINNNNLKDKITLLFLTDFKTDEKEYLTKKIFDFNGQLEFGEADNIDPEMNEAYLVFSNPFSAYKFIKSMKN
jgi:hypothetical protein